MRRSLIGAAGVAGLGVAAAAASRRSASRALTSFYRPEVGNTPIWELREARVRPPLLLHRSDGLAALVPAEYEAVAAALPTDELQPLRLPGGRAVVLIGAYRHHEISISAADGSTLAIRPYAEVLIAPLVAPRPASGLAHRAARRPAGPRPAVPFAFPRRLGAAFVLHFPATSRLVCELGRPWGFPRFVSDVDVEDDPASTRVCLSEGGQTILTLAVRSGGRLAFDRRPTVRYSVRDAELIETRAPTLAYRQMGRGGAGSELMLGRHDVAGELRLLGLSQHPIVAWRELLSRMRLPAGTAVGPARACEGFAGGDVGIGRYTVRHPGEGPVDQYMHLPPSEYSTAGPAARAPDVERIAPCETSPFVEDAEDLAALGLS